MPPFTRLIACTTTLLFLSACSDDSDNQVAAQPVYDFAALDVRFQQFLDESAAFEGISVVLVDAQQGSVHEAAFGDHTLDTVVILASTSKMPSVSLLMALHDDNALEFDIEASIDNYLPWEGVYGDRTTAQLVSNTSGIPGLSKLGVYGPHMCQLSSTTTLDQCARILYSVELEGSVAPGTRFDYGGSQWHLSGAVAEHVANSTWVQPLTRILRSPASLKSSPTATCG